MQLTVYKGFDKAFLERIVESPLCCTGIDEKLNVLHFDRKYRRNLDVALLSLEDEDNVWATYEEYSFIKNRVEDAQSEDSLKVTIYKNNLYPDYYPRSASR